MAQTIAAEEVPTWCGFFDVDQFEAFREEVDDACDCFGAAGQEIESGFVELAAGVHSDIYAFSLAQLAKRCAAEPREDWEGLIFGQIDDWSAAEAQAEWLEQATFEQVRDSLRIHLFDGSPRYDDEPEEAEEVDEAYEAEDWFRLPLADGLWIGLVVAGTPSTDEDEDEPEIDTQVHNAAVQAWGVEPDRLVEVALANLRREEGMPTWEELVVEVSDEDGQQVETITLLTAENAAWVLLLDEVAPELAERGVVLAVPSQDTLLVAEAAEPDALDLVVTAVADVARDHLDEAEVGYGLSDDAYWYQQGALSVFEETDPDAD
ncbi:hypothetical protein [Saccharopolyspora sp. 5N708]|uniref:hypothetical protein n=1 Tax=Saccharopolyspora sp. 5N708 TaxID=3457424 RepID=UPI003FD1B5FA